MALAVFNDPEDGAPQDEHAHTVEHPQIRFPMIKVRDVSCNASNGGNRCQLHPPVPKDRQRAKQTKDDDLDHEANHNDSLGPLRQFCILYDRHARAAALHREGQHVAKDKDEGDSRWLEWRVVGAAGV